MINKQIVPPTCCLHSCPQKLWNCVNGCPSFCPSLTSWWGLQVFIQDCPVCQNVIPPPSRTQHFHVNFQQHSLFLPNRRISFSCRASYCPLTLNCFSCTYQEPFLGSRGGGNCGIRSPQCALNISECSHWQRQEGERLKSRSWGTVLREL